MSELIKTIRNWQLTATTPLTAHKSEHIDKSHVIIESQYRNTQLIYLAVMMESTTIPPIKAEYYDVIKPNQVKFYGAEKGQKIKNIYAYVVSGTQYLNIYASNGTMIFDQTFKPTWDSITPVLEAEETLNDSDKTFTVGTDEEWMIISIWIEFATTATVGNRLICIEILDTTDDVISRISAYEIQAASLSKNYLFAPYFVHRAAPANDYNTVLPDFVIPSGYDIRVYDINGIDVAADDMNVQMLVKKRKVI